MIENCYNVYTLITFLIVKRSYKCFPVLYCIINNNYNIGRSVQVHILCNQCKIVASADIHHLGSIVMGTCIDYQFITIHVGCVYNQVQIETTPICINSSKLILLFMRGPHIEGWEGTSSHHRYYHADPKDYTCTAYTHHFSRLPGLFYQSRQL